jgi:hypothetical protein
MDLLGVTFLGLCILFFTGIILTGGLAIYRCAKANEVCLPTGYPSAHISLLSNKVVCYRQGFAGYQIMEKP